MYRVKHLSELDTGVEVWIYGNPFSPEASKHNPLKVIRSSKDKVYNCVQFESANGILQICSKVWEDTYIFLSKPTPAELLAMYLNGIDIGERKE